MSRRTTRSRLAKVMNIRELHANPPQVGLGSALASWVPRMVLRTLLVGLVSGPCAGCLVTDEIMFENEPNFPPVILDAPSPTAPIGSHVWIDSSADVKTWPLSVRVRDKNINQPLVAHWRVVADAERKDPSFEPLNLPPGLLVRDLKILVQTEALELGTCHKLELVVSGSFFKKVDPAYFEAVPDGAEDDVAKAVWWLLEGDMHASAEEKARLIDTCNAVNGVVASDSVVDQP